MRIRMWLAALLLLAGCRQAVEIDDARRQEHLQSFDYVWETVRDKHYDPKLGGVDWDAARAELRPLVEAAKTDDDARAAMVQLLDRLKLSHYAIAPAGAKPRHELGNATPPLAQDAPAEMVQFANLPEISLRHHYQRLPENIGYFYLSIFLEPGRVMPAYRKAIADARACDGFVLDLRHNPGGIGGMAMGMGNVFVTKPDQKLGTMIQRDLELKFVLTPQAEPHTTPLAILIDSGSASTAEILAGGLQDIGRARVFGTRSAGMALPSVVEKLPNGDTFQYAIANYISTGGQTLEGRGVEPDEVVTAEPSGDNDPVLAAAVKWIKSQTEKKQ
ncbi:MAG: hypothetical protein H7144_08355 [Burkholderiales bacterium]|nr:hypothetical protein [Phycisphaerae bacterium]